MSWLKGLILSFLLFSPMCLWAAPQGVNQLVIVKSSNNTYFDQTATTLIKHIDPGIQFKIVLAQDLSRFSGQQSEQILFVALGKAAVVALNKLDFEPNSINAYLTHEQYRLLKLEKQTTVLLNQPLYRYLAFCKFMLGSESIGIITDKGAEPFQEQVRTLKGIQLRLNTYQIDPDNKLLPVLRDLLRQNDVLLMLPRQSVYNRDTLKGVLLTSYRSRKPVISYSPAHVKSGALASIYSSPVDIGRHLALLVHQKLRHQTTTGPVFEFARFYSITKNRRVARALGINLPEERDIRSKLDRLGQ